MLLRGLLAWSLCCSLLAFLLFAHDKRAARRNRPRIPERTLLALALVGGWPGALTASRLFRHKTLKASFVWRFRLAVVLNLAACTAIVWLAMAAH